MDDDLEILLSGYTLEHQKSFKLVTLISVYDENKDRQIILIIEPCNVHLGKLAVRIIRPAKRQKMIPDIIKFLAQRNTDADAILRDGGGINDLDVETLTEKICNFTIKGK